MPKSLDELGPLVSSQAAQRGPTVAERILAVLKAATPERPYLSAGELMHAIEPRLPRKLEKPAELITTVVLVVGNGQSFADSIELLIKQSYVERVVTAAGEMYYRAL